MENKSHAVLTGVFVLVMAGMLAALAYWLTRDDTVRVRYEISSADAISGLQAQATVRYKGVPVGRVTTIGLDPQARGNVLITISVDENAPITQATYATLTQQGLTGLSFIQLDDQAGAPQVALTATAGLPRIPLRANLLSRLSDQGGAILAQVEQSAQRVNALLAPQNQQALVKAVTQLGEAAASIQALSARAQSALGPAQGPGSVNLQLLADEAGASLRSMRAATERIAAGADAFRLASDEYRKLGQRLTEPGGTLERLNHSAEALSVSAKTLNSTLLPRVARTAADTQRSVRQLGQAAQDMSEQPQQLIWGRPEQPPGPGEEGFAVPQAR